MSSPTSSLNLTYPPPRTFKPYRCLYPFCIKQYLSSAALEVHYATHPLSPAEGRSPPTLSTSNTSTPSSTSPSTPSPPSSPTTNLFARMKPARSHTAPAAVSQVHISRPSIAPTSSGSRRHHMRSSSSTTATSISTDSGRERKRDPRTSGTVTRCGRHGDEWLFGGWSVRGAVRGLWG